MGTGCGADRAWGFGELLGAGYRVAEGEQTGGAEDGGVWVDAPSCFSPPQPPAAENNGILSVFPSSAKCPRSPKQFALRGHTFSCLLEGCFHTNKLSEREEPM